ncbi:hypothetical protein D9M68_954300 [compost metagenome]
MAVEPQPLEFVLQDVDGQQRLIGLQHVIQMHGLSVAQVFLVAQQQPACGFEYPSGRTVVPQAIGLVHADPIDYLAPIT